MPTSSHVHISRMLDHIVRVQPRSILDVGVGFGKWGVLCREFLEIPKGRYDRASWTLQVDGVEAHPGYRNVNHDVYYNTIHYGTIQSAIPTLGEYDLIIMGDVIEHFGKDEGQKVLHQLLKLGKYVLVSSPVWFFQQEHEENPYQEHQSLWNIRDFSGLRFDYDEYIAYIFVALIEGEVPHDIHLDPRPSMAAYRWSLPRRRPLVAALTKSIATKALKFSGV